MTDLNTVWVTQSKDDVIAVRIGTETIEIPREDALTGEQLTNQLEARGYKIRHKLKEKLTKELENCQRYERVKIHEIIDYDS